jgi:hypothetical protein
MHTLGPNDDDETEVVIVRTNIKAPTPKPFVLDDDNKGIYTLNANPNDDDENQSLTVDDNNFGMVASDVFAATTNAVLTFAAVVEDNAGTADTDESADAFETEGTFRGASGTYKCNGVAGSTCTVTITDGEISAVQGTWVFTPDPGVMVYVEDTDYLYYGFWLKRTTEDGATEYNEVETFSGSRMVAYDDDNNGAAMSSVGGMATYNGGAAGVYVHKVNPSGGPNPDSATSGHFSANVELNAYFGGENVAPSKVFSITGTIDNFVLSGGEEIGWSVNLKDPDDETTGFRSGANSFSGGDAEGGGNTGSWSGTFYGASDEYDHDKNPATEMIRRQPAAIAGEFNANFSNGTAAGGFGARKE